MKSIKISLLFIKYFNALINCGTNPDDSQKMKLKKQIVSLLPVIIGIAAAIWGSIYFILGHYLSASIPLSYSLISVVSLIYFSYSKNVDFLQTSQLVLVLLLPFLLMWSLGGFSYGSYVMIWAFYAPLAAIAFSKKYSLLWLSLFMLLTFISAMIDNILIENITKLPSLAINIFSVLNIVAGFGGIYHIMNHFINEKESASLKLEILNQNLEEKVEAAIAKEKQTHSLLIRQSKLASMGEMISMIAHQWRQPLSAISATTGSMQFKVALDKYEKDFFNDQLTTIASISQHLSSTIEDFRNFFKPDKQRTTFRLKQAALSAIKLNESMFKSQNINLETHCNADIEINSYENEIVQVLINYHEEFSRCINGKKYKRSENNSLYI